MTPTPKRHWFRFSLLALFTLMTLIAVSVGWLANGWQRACNRASILLMLQDQQSVIVVGNDEVVPVAWRLFGAEAYESIYFDRDGLSLAECQAIVSAFPEAEVVSRSDREWDPE